MPKNNKTNIKVVKGTLLEKKDPTETCNAVVGDHYCTSLAGDGTDHAGTGRCKLHGGCAKGRPRKGFSPADYLNNVLVKTFQEASEFDPTTLTNLDGEINVLRSGLYKYLKDQETDKKSADVSEVRRYTDGLVKLAEAKAKLEGNVKEKHIPTQMIVYFANRMTEILVTRVKDQELLQQIAADMKKIQLDQLASNESA